MDEENAEDEMEIAENGPLLIYADSILKKAMNSYWKNETVSGKWHFVKQSSQRLISQSQVISRLKSQKSKLSFMN